MQSIVFQNISNQNETAVESCTEKADNENLSLNDEQTNQLTSGNWIRFQPTLSHFKSLQLLSSLCFSYIEYKFIVNDITNNND